MIPTNLITFSSSLAYFSIENLHEAIFYPDEFIQLLKSITKVPEKVLVLGNLSMGGCDVNLSFRLPSVLHIEGDFWLEGADENFYLPEKLHVGKHLNLFCSSKTFLPTNLHVEGNLCIAGSDITSLPEGLYVGGMLDIGHTKITCLPENIYIGGCLVLDHSSLTALPNWITSLGKTKDGTVRTVDIKNTSLSEDILERLRSTQIDGMQFICDNPSPPRPEINFLSLEKAIIFWNKEANTETCNTLTLTHELDLVQFCSFLARLTATADYKNVQTRHVLAKRVVAMLNIIAMNNKLCETACTLVHEGISSCDDRIISALQEIELVIMLHEIESTRHTEEDLRKLGKSFLLLQMVHEKACEHKQKFPWVDEVEVYLAFELGLSARFSLPVQTENMIFRRCAQISDKKIQEIGDELELLCTAQVLEIFLLKWSPWLTFQRRQTFIVSYEEITSTNIVCDNETICPITNDHPLQPVFLDGVIFEYKALIECYFKTGYNPISRNLIDVTRITRPFTLSSLKIS